MATNPGPTFDVLSYLDQFRAQAATSGYPDVAATIALAQRRLQSIAQTDHDAVLAALFSPRL